MLFSFFCQVFKIFAKNWSLRKEGLNEVRSHLDGVEERDKELLRNILRATVFLIVKLLKDKVIAVSHFEWYHNSGTFYRAVCVLQNNFCKAISVVS